MKHVQNTGLDRCFDSAGRRIDCAGTGQDAEFGLGLRRHDRFVLQGETVLDAVTGLVWSACANPLDFPLTWDECLDEVRRLNREGYAGHDDWRMPNRRELRSLVSHGDRKPALPRGHPFESVYLGWYWTSTTSAMSPAYAWYVHMEGGRMFYGRKKDQYCLLWPCRGESAVVPATGQQDCFDPAGRRTECAGTGQDGELGLGAPWPEPRFADTGGAVTDRLTDLVWHPQAGVGGTLTDWQGALDLVARLNAGRELGRVDWRLPNINELESLVDASRHSPALPEDHPFRGWQEAYWSSTTSGFETDWAYCLYLHKGAVGVCHKPGEAFCVWPVAG
jgi:hypothetical protein